MQERNKKLKKKGGMFNSYNILYIANYGEIRGGGEISLLNLIKNLSRDKFKPFVVSPFRGSLTDILGKLGIPVKIIRCRTLKNPLNVFSFFYSIIALLKFIKKEKIDLVHSNATRGTFYSGISARLANVPFIWHVRVIDSEGLWDKVLSSLCTKIIVISDAVKRRFSWIKDRGKVIRVYNGVDLNEFKENISGNKIREEYNLNLDTKIVGIVGRLVSYKGHRYFLEAARRVRQESEDRGQRTEDSSHQSSVISHQSTARRRDKRLWTMDYGLWTKKGQRTEVRE